MSRSSPLTLSAFAALAMLSGCRTAETDPATMNADTTVTDKNCCVGKNACKGQGGCAVPGKNGCAGKNECKGQGGCNMHCKK